MNSRPLVVTAYRRELVQQHVEQPLSILLEENQSSAVCFSISASSQYLVGDSAGNLFVGSRVNKQLEFSVLAVFSGSFQKIICDQQQYIAIGREKDSADAVIKIIEQKQKKLSIKSTFQTQLRADVTTAVSDSSSLVIGDKSGQITAFKLPKLRLLFTEAVKFQAEQQQILNVGFITIGSDQTLRPDQSPLKTDLKAFVASTPEQHSVFVFNQAGDFEQLQLSTIFTLTPSYQNKIVITDNRLVTTAARSRPGHHAAEVITIMDQKVITSPSDLREVTHVTRVPFLPQIYQKDAEIHLIMSFKPSEYLLITDQSTIVFNNKNRILFQFQAEQQNNNICAFNSVSSAYTLLNTSSNQFVELVPVESELLIDSLLNEQLYEEALNVATDPRARTRPHKIASVRLNYCKTLFERAEFQLALQQFKLTIGVLEPSVVVRAFLEYGRTVELAGYIEELIAQNQAQPAHTNLLISCYTKNGDSEKLVKFIQLAEHDFFTSQKQPVFEVRPTVQNLLGNKMDELAAECAAVFGEKESAVQIMIRSSKFLQAIGLVQISSAGEATQLVKKFGGELLDAEQEKVTEIVRQLCTTWTPSGIEELQKQHHWARLVKQSAEIAHNAASIDSFFSLFVEQRHEIALAKILLHLAGLAVEKKISISAEAVETLFELLLKQLKAKANGGQCETSPEAVLALLQQIATAGLSFSYDQLLVLFQTYNCKDCVIFVLLQLNMRQECIKFYVQNGQFSDAVRLFQDASDDQKLQLYQELLELSINTGSDDNVRLTLKLLENNQQISPLTVVDLLNQFWPDLKLEIFSDYLFKKLVSAHEATQQQAEQFFKTAKNVDAVKQQIAELRKPKVYNRLDCNKCKAVVEPPAVLLRCGHVYHEHCWAGTCSCWSQFDAAVDLKERKDPEARTVKDILGGLQ